MQNSGSTHEADIRTLSQAKLVISTEKDGSINPVYQFLIKPTKANALEACRGSLLKRMTEFQGEEPTQSGVRH